MFKACTGSFSNKVLKETPIKKRNNYGGVAQMVRAQDSYPLVSGRQFGDNCS